MLAQEISNTRSFFSALARPSMSADSGSDSPASSPWSSNRDGCRNLRVCERCDHRKDNYDSFCSKCEWCCACRQYKDWTVNDCGDCSRCYQCSESRWGMSACCVCDVYFCDTCLTWPKDDDNDDDEKDDGDDTNPRFDGPVCDACEEGDG